MTLLILLLTLSCNVNKEAKLSNFIDPGYEILDSTSYKENMVLVLKSTQEDSLYEQRNDTILLRKLKVLQKKEKGYLLISESDSIIPCYSCSGRSDAPLDSLKVDDSSFYFNSVLLWEDWYAIKKFQISLKGLELTQYLEYYYPDLSSDSFELKTLDANELENVPFNFYKWTY